jgi:serine/threonine protein kinase|tara:strand:+ start:633 stop:1118 length:486 start_codon:yes stop_codon:yes gene_type:complete
VQAMLYCHSRGVIHRDLKLENVLFKNQGFINDDFFIKVVDFGIAGVAQDKVDSGTLAYMSPECLDKVDTKTSAAIDVWAIGIMFYTMIYGELPFYGNTERDLIKKIINEPVKFNNKYPISDMGKNVIKSMLQKDPTKRIELIEFVQSDYNTLEDEEFDNIY